MEVLEVEVTVGLQRPIDEYAFAVMSIKTDLRDGVRLVRLVSARNRKLFTFEVGVTVGL